MVAFPRRHPGASLLLMSVLTFALTASAPDDAPTCAAAEAAVCGAAAIPWTEVADTVTAWKPGPDAPLGSPRVHVVMQVTEPIGGYGRLGFATAAMWARSHGHTISVHRELEGGSAGHPTPEGMDHRFGKVELLRRFVATDAKGISSSCPAPWLLWLDADVFVTVREDWASRLIHENPGAQLIGSRHSGGDGIINTGAVLVKCGAWASDFLTRWWTHPAASSESTDQYVLGKLIEARTDDAFIRILPVHAMNCDTFWWNSFVPGSSPVLHLMNTPNSVREALGTRILAQTCAASCGGAYGDWRWFGNEYEASLRRAIAPVVQDGNTGGLKEDDLLRSVTYLAMYLVQQANEYEAEQVLVAGLGYADRLGLQAPLVRAVLADVLARQRKFAEADRLVSTALEHLHTQSFSGPAGYPFLYYSVLRQHANLKKAAGQINGSLTLFNEVIRGEEHEFGEGHPVLARTYSELALVLTEASQNALAAEYHQRAVDIDLATLGSSHPDAVLRLAHLAAALFRVGRPQEGAGFFDRAIQIVHTLTFDGTDMIMAQLGDVLKKCQQLQAADNLYAAALERVLMKVDTAAGEAPPHAYYSVLTKRANLAKETGHYADAAGMYEQVLRVQQAELGEEHPMVSSTLSLLGLALSALGQHSAAVVHHRRSLAISERTKSADDPDVTRSLGNLGAALLQAGQQAEGIGYLQRAADASEGTSDVAGLAKRLGNLAMAVEDKEPVRALELYSRALDLTRTVHGDSHPDTSTALGNLATSMVGTGQLKEALPLFEQALQVDKAVYGEEHPAVATDLHNIGYVQFKMDRTKKRALANFSAALAIREKVLPPNHPETQSTRNWVGKCSSKPRRRA